jgi:hypothetical protein
MQRLRKAAGGRRHEMTDCYHTLGEEVGRALAAALGSLLYGCAHIMRAMVQTERPNREEDGGKKRGALRT